MRQAHWRAALDWAALAAIVLAVYWFVPLTG